MAANTSKDLDKISKFWKFLWKKQLYYFVLRKRKTLSLYFWKISFI